MLLHNGKRYNGIVVCVFLKWRELNKPRPRKMTRRKRPPPQSPPRNSTTEQQEAKRAKPDDDKPSEKVIVPQAGPGGRDW